MFSNIRTLLLVTVTTGVMALLSPVSHAEITITRQEVQWDEAVVMGLGAAANDTIYWGDDPIDGLELVDTASKRGKFSFRGDVPSDCIGALSTTADDPDPVNVPLDNCTPDSGGGGDPGTIPELPLFREQTGAHNGDAVRAVGFVADGEGGVRVISGGDDAFLRSWSWSQEDTGNLTPEVYGELAHPIYDLESSAYGPGSIVVTGEGDWNGGPGSDTLRVWDAFDFLASEGITVPLEGTTAPIGFVYCVAVSPNRQWTVASGFYGEIVVYDSSSLALNATRNTKKKRTKALAFSPDGATLASTSTAGRIQLWSFPQDCDSTSCELELFPVSLSHGGSWNFPIAFAPYSEPEWTEIVSGSDGGTIKVWTIDLTGTPTVVSVLPVATGAVYSLDWWSPDDPEDSMIVAGGDGNITVYDASMEVLFQTVNAHGGRVNDVVFSPDGTMIASGGADGVLKLWDLGGG